MGKAKGSKSPIKFIQLLLPLQNFDGAMTTLITTFDQMTCHLLLACPNTILYGRTRPDIMTQPSLL
jgi:hypothetical protein